MKLKQNHGIIAECIARKSIGKDHAKWTPSVACNFKYIPKVKINYSKVKKLSKNDKQGIVDSCPTNVMTLREHDGSIEVINEEACT